MPDGLLDPYLNWQKCDGNMDFVHFHHNVILLGVGFPGFLIIKLKIAFFEALDQSKVQQS